MARHEERIFKSSLAPFPYTRARVAIYADETADGEEEDASGEPHIPLPTFDVGMEWPWPLKQVADCGTTPAQRDAMLLASLTVPGASMERKVRFCYGRRMYHPCLQTFIVAPSASGKGLVSLTRLLVEPIHDAMRREVGELMKKYVREKREYDLLGKERASRDAPEKPANRMFLIAGNNTGTGILQNLMDSDGTGLIFESEADTISTAIGSDYGHWSDTLRKAFDHDFLSYNRRTDGEYREMKKSYLSVLLSGTPAQVAPLIPSPENGLFSRQLFYFMPGLRRWQSQIYGDLPDLERTFRTWGNEWKAKVKQIQLGGLFTLRLTAEQRRAFDRRFWQIFARARMVNGDEMSSTVVRLAINTVRMMEVVAMLRAVEQGDFYAATLVSPDRETPRDNLLDHIVTRWNLDITPADFHAVLNLAEPLYRHAAQILSYLPRTAVRSRGNADRDALLAAMDVQFTHAEFVERAGEMGFNRNTADNWLRRMVKNWLLESPRWRSRHLP